MRVRCSGKYSVGACLLFGLATLPVAVAAQDVVGLGLNSGHPGRIPHVSGDGSIVVGNIETGNGVKAFRWSAEKGAVDLSNQNGDPAYLFFALDVNGNGSVVVGGGVNINARDEAFRWTANTGMLSLGFLSGGSFSGATAVNRDGSVVAGNATDGRGLVAFRWTRAGGMVSLGRLPNSNHHSQARDISGDGSVIVGTAVNANGDPEAFRWTATTGMVGLGFLAGTRGTTDASAVSRDGSVVVGGSTTPQAQAFRWTAASGMVGLGYLPGDDISFAQAVNADGSVVVGGSRPSKGLAVTRKAFYWTKPDGIRSLRDVLKSQGADVIGIRLYFASGVSDDGLFVVGNGDFGDGNEPFIARLLDPDSPPPNETSKAPTTGLVTLSELSRSISQIGVVIDGANAGSFFDLGSLATVGTKLAFPRLGAQANSAAQAPEMRLGAATPEVASDRAKQPANQSFGFVIGSLFGHDKDDIDARRGNGIAGLGVQVLPGLTLGGGIVVSATDGELPFRGDYTSQSVGAGAFLSYIPGRYGFQFVATGSVRHIDFEIDRGYLNGATPDVSRGETDGTAWGGLIRTGYAFPFIATSTLTPFAEFAIAHSDVDGYAENGGAFPVTYDEMSETERRIRLGAEIRTPILEKVEGWALGRLEQAVG
jgi:probable HAF family extracellular repeat protein